MHLHLQQILDAFYWLRKHFVTAITYFSFRLYGSEINWSQLRDGKFDSTKHNDRNLDQAGDLSLLLSEAKDGLKDSEARLAVVTDKCKNLLTVSSFLLTLVTVLIAKVSFDSVLMRICFVISALAFFDTIILLMVFFDVGVGMTINITQQEVELRTDDLRKCLINLYFRCRTVLDNRTDYLVEVYKVARFFFLSAFTVLVSMLILQLFLMAPNDSAKAVVRELRADTNFLQSVKGEKGDPGPKGDPGLRGEKGDNGERIIPISNQCMGPTNCITLPIK
jgi:hypothetical protein